MCEVLHDCQQFDFFEILKLRQRGSLGVYLKKSSFQKCPKCIITYNYVFLNIIHNISVSGVFKFPIFEQISISTKFRQNLFFFWKLLSGLIVFAVLRIVLTNTFVYLQYASSGFEQFEFFRNSKISSTRGYWLFPKNSIFPKFPKCVISYNCVLLNIIYIISM
jgi:hypothetical protein